MRNTAKEQKYYLNTSINKNFKLFLHKVIDKLKTFQQYPIHPYNFLKIFFLSINGNLLKIYRKGLIKSEISTEISRQPLRI